MTKSLEQFKADTLGGSFGNPGTGTYVGQCVSYARLYMEVVLNIKTDVWGHAVDYWSNPAVLQYFDRVRDGRDGDIPVWGDDPDNWTGKEGHIAIKYGNQILNQNFGGSLRVSVNPMFTQGFLGYLRLKGGEDMARNQELEAMANNRQKMLDDIAALYSVPAPLDGNSLPLLLNNIRAEKNRIDELTGIVSRLEQQVESTHATSPEPVELTPGIYLVK